MQDNKRKIEKLSSILQNLSAGYFKTQSDFKPGIITVTGVDVSLDKSYSVVWVSLIGIDEASFSKQIEKHQKQLRKYISENQNFRYTPTIKLNIDNSSEEILRINKLLEE